MNDMTPPVRGRRAARVQSARSGLHRRSLSVLSPPARDGAGLQDAAGLLADHALRGRGFRPARQALRQGFRRQHEAPLRRRRRHERAGHRQPRPHHAGAGPARPHAAARPGDQGLHRPPRRRHAAAHQEDRRRAARPRGRQGRDGRHARSRASPAGDRDLRHAGHPRGSSRAVPGRQQRQRPHPRAGADDAARRLDQANLNTQMAGVYFRAALRAAPPRAAGRPHHRAGAGRGGGRQAHRRGAARPISACCSAPATRPPPT